MAIITRQLTANPDSGYSLLSHHALNARHRGRAEDINSDYSS